MPTTASGAHHPFISAEARERFLADYELYGAGCPIAWETVHIETDRGSVFVRSLGSPASPALVLLPGAGSHSLFWPVDIVRALARTHRVHAIDPLDDIGRSVSSIGDVKAPDHMSMLDQLLDQLAPGARVVMMGGSRGAWMTAEYALHAPERLTGCIWLSPALVATGWGLGAFRFVALSMPVMREATIDNVAAMLRWILPRFAAQQPEEFERMVRHTAVCYQCFDTKRVGRGFGPRRFSSRELASIRVPTLYLAGVDEKLGSSKAALDRLHRVAPGIDAAVIRDAGHDLVWVRSAEVVRRVTEFLNDV